MYIYIYRGRKSSSCSKSRLLSQFYELASRAVWKWQILWKDLNTMNINEETLCWTGFFNKATNWNNTRQVQRSNTQITWILENETSDSEAFSFSKAGYTHKFRWHFPESCRISFLGGVHIAPQSLGDGHSSLMMCFHLPEKASIQAANAWLTVWNHLGSPAKLGWVDVCMIVNA